MIRGRVADLLLAVLLVVAVGLSAYAVLRQPPGSVPAGAAEAPRAGAAVPRVRTTPVAATPTAALLLAPPGAETGHVTEAARLLRWRLGPRLPLTSQAGLPQAVRGQRLVLVQATADSADSAATAVGAVRAVAPAVRLVVVGPLGLDGAALLQERELLRDAAAQAGADFVDPVQERWRESLPAGPVVADALTPAARQALGRRLATALKQAEAVRSASGAP